MNYTKLLFVFICSIILIISFGSLFLLFYFYPEYWMFLSIPVAFCLITCLISLYLKRFKYTFDQ